MIDASTSFIRNLCPWMDCNNRPHKVDDAMADAVGKPSWSASLLDLQILACDGDGGDVGAEERIDGWISCGGSEHTVG